MFEHTFHSASPDKIEYTVKVTMTLKDWRLVKGDLSGSTYPSRLIIERLDDMIRQAEKTFFSLEDVEEKAE